MAGNYHSIIVESGEKCEGFAAAAEAFAVIKSAAEALISHSGEIECTLSRVDEFNLKVQEFSLELLTVLFENRINKIN